MVLLGYAIAFLGCRRLYPTYNNYESQGGFGLVKLQNIVFLSSVQYKEGKISIGVYQSDFYKYL